MKEMSFIFLEYYHKHTNVGMSKQVGNNGCKIQISPLRFAGTTDCRKEKSLTKREFFCTKVNLLFKNNLVKLSLATEFMSKKYRRAIEV